MSNYNSFVFCGHGFSEVDGSFDPGATAQGKTENALARKINGYAKEYLDRTPLAIHYDEQNYKDVDLKGNSYSAASGITTHINAGKGTGTELFVPVGRKDLKQDFELVSSISSALGIANRGVKSRVSGSGETVKRTDGVSLSGKDYYKEIKDAWNLGNGLVILEVGFIDTTDLTKMETNTKKVGYLIAKYICSRCGVTVPPYETPASPQPSVTSSYKIKITADVLNVRSGAGVNYSKVTVVNKNEVYTIIDTKNGWGKLKSGAGWISLQYTTKI